MDIEQTVIPEKRSSSAGSVVAETLRNRGFVACAVLLCALTAGFHLITRSYTFVKEALPLKIPLGEMSQSRLLPYELVKTIDLSSDVLGPLGTDQYLQWLLREPDAPDGKGTSPLFSFFVTYYTGSPDAVPHVPDRCYVGSGYLPKEEGLDEITVASGGHKIAVPLQVLEFEKDSQLDQSKRVVVYTFHANGQFRKDRTAVRLAIGSLSDRYAYFSKVEVSMSLEPGRFSKDQAVGLAKRFLQVAIPVLLEDHWPDWEAANKRAATKPAGSPK